MGLFTILITFVYERPSVLPVWSVATVFFAMASYLDYLISLCTVILLRMGLYFFNSKRSGVFFLFFVVI